MLSRDLVPMVRECGLGASLGKPLQFGPGARSVRKGNYRKPAIDLPTQCPHGRFWPSILRSENKSKYLIFMVSAEGLKPSTP